MILACVLLLGGGCKHTTEPENDRQVLMRLHSYLAEKDLDARNGRDLTDAEIADAHMRCKRSPDLADECELIDRLVAKLRAKP